MKINVTVFRRPNMFVVNNNLFNMIGVGELEKLFTIPDYKTTHSKLTLYYPERFLNTLEQRALVVRAEKAGYKEIEITTHSVYIIQCVANQNVGIAQVEPEGFDMSENGFVLSVNEVGMPYDGGIGVM